MIKVECFLKASMTNEVSFQHRQRDANRVAHEWARNAYRSKYFLLWDGDPPRFIKHVVINKVAILSHQ
jgi:hypothetical protein